MSCIGIERTLTSRRLGYLINLGVENVLANARSALSLSILGCIVPSSDLASTTSHHIPRDREVTNLVSDARNDIFGLNILLGCEDILIACVG